MSKRPTPHSALAATLGQTTRELSEYRYQSTRTPHAIYAIGSEYYCVRATKPDWRSDEIDWQPVRDQFWAGEAGSIVWEGKSR